MTVRVVFEDGDALELDWDEDTKTGVIDAKVNGGTATCPVGYPAVGWPWRYVQHEPYGAHLTAKVVSVDDVEHTVPAKSKKA
jgi:hypothetical protein